MNTIRSIVSEDRGAEFHEKSRVAPYHKFPPAVPPAPFSETTLRVLAKEVGVKVPRATKAKLKGLQVEFERGFALLQADAAHSTWRLIEIQAQDARKFLQDPSAKVRFAADSGQMMKERIAGARRAIKTALRAASNEACDLCRPLLEEFRQKARALVAALEEAEQARSKAYDVPYVQSPFLAQLTLALDRAANRVPNPGLALYHEPLKILSFLADE